MPRKLSTLLLPVVTGGLFLAIWIAWRHALSPDQRFLLPAPTAVWQALLDNRAVLARAAFNTAEGALLGLGLAVAASLILAVLLSLSPLVRAGLYPYLMMLQMTPVIVFAPMLVIWVGPGLASVTVITFLICFFPLVVNTTQGLISTDRQLVELFQTYRARRWQEIWLLRLPAALPYFFTGLRIAATLAPIGALVGDYTAGSSAGDGGGLGFQTIVFSAHLKYPALFATAAVTCALGFGFVAVVSWLSRRALVHWHDSYRSQD